MLVQIYARNAVLFLVSLLFFIAVSLVTSHAAFAQENLVQQSSTPEISTIQEPAVMPKPEVVTIDFIPESTSSISDNNVIHNPKLQVRQAGVLEVSFTIENNTDNLQSNIGYSIDILKKDDQFGDELAAARVSTETFNLQPNESKEIETTYTVPSYLLGVYEVQVTIISSDEHMKDHEVLNSIYLNGTGDYIKIIQEGCVVSIESQNIPLSIYEDLVFQKGEDVTLNCFFINHSSSTLVVKPTFYSFGQNLENIVSELDEINFKAGEAKDAFFKIPISETSQINTINFLLQNMYSKEPSSNVLIIQYLVQERSSPAIKNEFEATNVIINYSQSAILFLSIIFIFLYLLFRRKGQMSKSQVILKSLVFCIFFSNTFFYGISLAHADVYGRGSVTSNISTYNSSGLIWERISLPWPGFGYDARPQLTNHPAPYVIGSQIPYTFPVQGMTTVPNATNFVVYIYDSAGTILSSSVAYGLGMNYALYSPPIAPDPWYRFSGTITAPSTAGTYYFGYFMVYYGSLVVTRWSNVVSFSIVNSLPPATGGNCGAAATSYAASDAAFTGQFCDAASLGQTPYPFFPSAGGSTSWQCYKSDWTLGPTCTATRDKYPDCSSATILGCSLPASTPYGSYAGSCATGYAGSCTYLCDAGSTWTLNYNGCYLPNIPPTANISVPSGNISVVSGTNIQFTGSGTDDDGSITAYDWHRGLSCTFGTSLSTSASFSTSALAVGSYTIYFRVQDNSGAWSPCQTRTVTVTNLPNLTAISTSPAANATLSAPSSITFTGSARNSAAAAVAEGGYAGLEIDWNSNGGAMPDASTGYDAYFDANAGNQLGGFSTSQTKALSYTYSNPPAGVHRYRFNVDSDGSGVGESNEADNRSAWRTFTITIPVPNLTAANTSALPTPAYATSTITFTGSARNSAAAAVAEGGYAGLEIDWNSNGGAMPDASTGYDVYVGANSGSLLGAFAVSETKTISAQYSNPPYANAPKGTHRYRFNVDSTNVVTESNEADNRSAWRTFTISNSLPVATITTPDPLSLVSVQSGAIIQFNGTAVDADSDAIVAYQWLDGSCSSGLKSSLQSPNISTTANGPANIAPGLHTIYFRVQDSSNAWSTNCPSIQINVRSASMSANPTGSPTPIWTGNSTRLTWNSTGYSSCNVFETVPGTTSLGLTGISGTNQTVTPLWSPLPTATTSAVYQLACVDTFTGTEYPAATVYVPYRFPSTPVLTINPRVVDQGGTASIIWDTNNNNETLCSVTGGTLGTSLSPLPSGGNVETGSSPLTVTGRTTYTLTCGALSDTFTVEIRPRGFET